MSAMQLNQYAMDDRVLKFTGYSLAGRSDLTTIGKATGETLWPCSLLLADYLNCDWDTNIISEGEGQRVLELGCGLGLCGTVASVRLSGKGHVQFTDRDEGVIERAKVMSRENYRKSADAPVSHSLLQWGDTQEMEKLKVSTPNANGYDIVLASDIIYHSTSAAVVEETARVFAETVNYLLAPTPTTTAKSKCFVAFQQRDIDVNVLYKAFERVGFTNRIPLGYYEDIFGERTEERTAFTTMFLLCFERKPIPS